MHERALAAWDLGEVLAEAHPGGLINPTWILRGPDGPVAVLQQLATRIFHPVVHEDIDAVTRHLEARGVPTPRLVPTRAGELWHTDDHERTWRCLTWVPARTIHRVSDLEEAATAGALLGRFHAALADLDWTFRHRRPGVHDTPRHARLLAEALDRESGHRLHPQVAPLGEEILAALDRLPGGGGLPERVIHGDPKLANVRFVGARAHALIDLDTVRRATLDDELGDALRSWCNRASEDRPRARFDLDVLQVAMAGYASTHPPTPAEWEAVLPATERICWELAARFARDALEESYFGWDASRHPGRGEHNLERAEGQASLARAVARSRAAAEAALLRARQGRRG